MRGSFKLLLVAVILGVGLAEEVKIDLILLVSDVFHVKTCSCDNPLCLSSDLTMSSVALGGGACICKSPNGQRSDLDMQGQRGRHTEMVGHNGQCRKRHQDGGGGGEVRDGGEEPGGQGCAGGRPRGIQVITLSPYLTLG